MTTAAFQKALRSTGYLTPSGGNAPGLVSANDAPSARLKAIFSNDMVGLNADAVFLAQNTATSIFKDVGSQTPSDAQIHSWHEAAWNIGVAPLLWIVTPTHVRLYDCYSSPPFPTGLADTSTSLADYSLQSEALLRQLDATCGRLATETGAFWSSEIGRHIDRRHRVDRELLAEIKALEDRLTDLSVPDDTPDDLRPELSRVARDLAQRFIGRCIFTWYLLDRQIAQRFLPDTLEPDLLAMFQSHATAFSLFDWLRTTFNGDLFPMDDPGAEREKLTDKHLALIRDFIEGRSLVPDTLGQGRLFRFRFEAIPVDLISSIYQQFARSSAAEQAASQALHYTPIELVHLTLDPVFEGLSPTARILDPTCGSGAFLVEAFRRLVWRSSEGHPPDRSLVRRVLYEQLFGVDINRAALGIAAFSLYLAALELDAEPITDIRDLRFDRLIGSTLFEADTIGGNLPPTLTRHHFDAVVGNPPWTFSSQSNQTQAPIAHPEGSARPRRSPDHAFLAIAAELAGSEGRVGMVMKATPFFSKDPQAVSARSLLFDTLAPVALVNLSFLRREGLFPDSTGPALLFFARCRLSTPPDSILVGSIPWTPDFQRTGVFPIGTGEIRSVSARRVIATPPILKATAFGSVRDGWLVERLERDLPTLDEALNALGIGRSNRGQGFQVKGRRPASPPDDYFTLPVVTSRLFTPFRLDPSKLAVFKHTSLHRKRHRSIFSGPLVICPKASSPPGVERGRYGAAISERDVLYTESFTGISFRDTDHRLAHVVGAILNSSLTAFQCAFSGSTWGLERPTMSPLELFSLRIPSLTAIERSLFDDLIETERTAAAAPQEPASLAALDDAVFELYGLERDERVIVREGIERARQLIFEGHRDRSALVRPPTGETLRTFAAQVIQSINAYLRARGERHLEAHVYPIALARTNYVDAVPGVTAVRFVMASGQPTEVPLVHDGNPDELQSVASLLRGKLDAEVAPYLNERRQLRLYGTNDLFILKPSETRYWTRTAGLNDADSVLADHWFQNRYDASRP